MSGAMGAGEWRHARRPPADRGRHPGAGDITGEVVRQAAGDGRGRMLVKTTAPRASGGGLVRWRSTRSPAPPGGWRAATANLARRIWPPRGSSVAGAGAGRCSTSSPAAGTAVPCGLPPRHPPAGLPASGCRDGVRPARGRPPPGPYERL